MGIRKFSSLFLGLALFFSVTVKADTMLDGYWQLDISQSVKCVGNKSIVAADAQAYLAKYSQSYLHLSDLQAVKYWITQEGEVVASPVFTLVQLKSNQVYRLQHTRTTIPDATLILLKNGDLEYRSQDYEWNLCQGGEYRVIFHYLRLNP